MVTGIWPEITPPSSSSEIPSNSQISFTHKRRIPEPTSNPPQPPGTFGDWAPNQLIKSPSWWAIEEPPTDSDIWTDTLLTLSGGSTKAVKPSGLNSTSKHAQESKTCQVKKLKSLSETLIMLLEILLTTSIQERPLSGTSRFKSSLKSTDLDISGTSSMWLKLSPMETIPWSPSESLSSTDMSTTISLKLNNPPSPQAISFQEWNLPWIKCFKEDYSPILTLTDIDLEPTTT